MRKKNIYIIYTGGTIGMLKTDHGFAPSANYLTTQLQTLSIFHHDEVPKFAVNEYSNLIDSSNIQPIDWIKIAKDIISNYHKYDGFIVLHGTDTMAYTASALSFMLKHLNKPVICTGSQIPLSELRTDALDNILDSLLICANYHIPEVCVYFNKKLLRGNRSRKVNANSMAAFDSPNFPALGNVGIDININEKNLIPSIEGEISLNILKSPEIAILTIFPGIDAKIIKYILDKPLKGLILKTYGAGNAPNNPALLQVLAKATSDGIIIVNCTQCLKGRVNMKSYATGKALFDAGVISAYDMTVEASLTKLFYLFSMGYDNSEIKRIMHTNIKGEVSLPFSTNH